MPQMVEVPGIACYARQQYHNRDRHIDSGAVPPTVTTILARSSLKLIRLPAEGDAASSLRAAKVLLPVIVSKVSIDPLLGFLNGDLRRGRRDHKADPLLAVPPNSHDDVARRCSSRLLAQRCSWHSNWLALRRSIELHSACALCAPKIRTVDPHGSTY